MSNSVSKDVKANVALFNIITCFPVLASLNKRHSKTTFIEVSSQIILLLFDLANNDMYHLIQ